MTWHPPPSPPQHPEALTCPIPNTLSTNEPNTSSSTCNTVHVGNRLSCNLMFWRQIGASNFVLSVVEHGYSLPFVHLPDRLFFRNLPSALKHYPFVSSAIGQLVTSGVVEETTAEALLLCSSLGAVPKKSGKLRLILDLRYLNEHVHTEKFTFEDLRLIPSIFRLDDLLFTFDLQDAYYHIPIAIPHRPYLGFAWSINGMQKFFQFKVLPFGLSTAPYVFTKITKPLAKHWRSQGIRMFWYLDDGTGGDQPYEKAARHSRIIRDDILRSGFRLNEAKSDFSPRCQAEVLGVVIDTKHNLMTASRTRVEAFLSIVETILASPGCVPVRTLARLTGMLASMGNVLGPITRLQTRALHALISATAEVSWDAYTPLSTTAFAEVRFWADEFHRFHGQPIWQQHPQPIMLVLSDASDTGWGCHCPAFPDMVARGVWPIDGALKNSSSTQRELSAVKFALQSLIKPLSNRAVCWASDNQNVTRILMHGSRIPHLHRDALDIFSLCQENRVRLNVTWVPREENQMADTLSRVTDSDDWRLCIETFRLLDDLWGPHSVDRFASNLSFQLPRFNSRWWCPGSEAVDAFTQNWAEENNWCVPPPVFLGRLYYFLLAVQCHSTVVVPEWPSAPWWPLWRPGTQWCQLVQATRSFDPRHGLCLPCGGEASIFGPARTPFRLIALRVCSKANCHSCTRKPGSTHPPH